MFEGQKGAVVRAAVRLFRRKGYAGVGLNEIVLASGAPKGSLYHYFPGGKAQIGAAAVAFGGGVATQSLRGLLARDPDPAAAALSYGDSLAEWMGRSQFRDGCPIATVVLETAPQETAITEAARAVFDDWRAAFRGALIGAGLSAERAQGLAQMAVCAFEGALILSRADGDAGAITATAHEVAHAFRQAVADAGRLKSA